ncbi:MAG TPA: 2'-5' RNA ligase family protein [Devosiaceae bacterium]|jgi:2'-5' RNA ligase
MQDMFADPLSTTSEPLDVLFFALTPDAAVDRQIQQLQRRLRLDFDLTRPPMPAERQHVSLMGLSGTAGFSRQLVDEATKAARLVSSSPFEIRFDRVSTFGGGSIVLCGRDVLPDTEQFREGLLASFRATPLRFLAERAHRHGFRPHLTLFYGEARALEVDIAPVTWTVRDFVLIHSLVGRSRHIHVGRWQL